MGGVGLGLCSVWFLVNDRVKLLAYRILDPTKPALLTRKPIDLNAQIAARATNLPAARPGRKPAGSGLA